MRIINAQASSSDSQTIHVKVDELIRVTEGAHKALLNLEELTDEELEKIPRQLRTPRVQRPQGTPPPQTRHLKRL